MPRVICPSESPRASCASTAAISPPILVLAAFEAWARLATTAPPLRKSGRARPKMTSAASASARSEEHTYELQSLMRTSYAVICLKKKKYSNHNPYLLTATHLHAQRVRMLTSL